jgi:AcrR family transcriptional regulator
MVTTSRRGRAPSDSLHQRILESAATLFARQGVDRTSTRDVARHASTTERTLYKHFGSKDQLVEAVVEHAFATHVVAEGLSDVSSGIQGYGGDFAAWHRHFLTDRLAAWQRSPELARLLLAELVRHAEWRERFGAHWTRAVWLPLVSLFEELQRQGILRTDIGANSLAREFLSRNLSFLVAQVLVGSPAAMDQAGEIMTISELFLKGAAASAANARPGEGRGRG